MTSSTKKSTIDRSSSIPLYKQIKEILIEELQAARSETGRPFSTEHELVQRFHVSRAPVRQALKELANEGYVYRERAKGTFPVQELPVRPAGLELGGLVGFLREQGIHCNSKILAVDHVFPTEKLCSILGTEPDDKVLRISRLIFLKEKPLAWAQTYLLYRMIFNRVHGNLKRPIVSSCSLRENKVSSFLEAITKFGPQAQAVWKRRF